MTAKLTPTPVLPIGSHQSLPPNTISTSKRGFPDRNYLGCHAPSLAVDLVDAVGCGDAILALTAPLEAAGTCPEVVNFLGQSMAAIQCTIPLNTEPVDPRVLSQFVTTLLT